MQNYVFPFWAHFNLHNYKMIKNGPKLSKVSKWSKMVIWIALPASCCIFVASTVRDVRFQFSHSSSIIVVSNRIVTLEGCNSLQHTP